jgi:hypothetical protein
VTSIRDYIAEYSVDRGFGLGALLTLRTNEARGLLMPGMCDEQVCIVIGAGRESAENKHLCWPNTVSSSR